MTHVRHLSFDSIQRAVRGAVCPICYQRPHGSETLANNVPRECEPSCPLFLHLPALYRIAVHNNTSSPGALEQAVMQEICGSCTLTTTAGALCPAFAARSCPLSRFSGEVVALLETLRDWQHRTTA